MKNLGCMNGWEARVWTLPNGEKHVEKADTTPQEFKDCSSKGHVRDRVSIGRCRSHVSCPICNIEYTVDSSD